MRLRFLLVLMLMLPVVALLAQDAKGAEDKEAAYTRTITTRAAKIVATLGITDSTCANRVTRTIADQYRNLNTIHTSRDEAVKAAKAKGLAKESPEIKKIEEKALTRQNKLHKQYIKKLSKQLSEEQVVKVKDGMTFGVVPITYKGYQDMIPTLTEAQKAQILAWLTEAREHAMDAESSEKKHWWFGKYKGRINNYLSAAGYDLKKEGDEWEKRRKAAAVRVQ
ncbi:MAG TPA: DUF3826 domain-containing protein [Chitinophagaceae bacterium]